MLSLFFFFLFLNKSIGQSQLTHYYTVVNIITQISLPCCPVTKGKGKGMVKEELAGPEVCKDPVRLTSYAVGVNIFKQGEDPKLKPLEEYPEW